MMRHEFAVYRPARGGGGHHVRVEYQLRLRGLDGTCLRLITYRIYTCCKVTLVSGPGTVHHKTGIKGAANDTHEL